MEILAEFSSDTVFANSAIERGLSLIEAKAERHDVLKARQEAVASLGVMPIEKAAGMEVPKTEANPNDFMAMAETMAESKGVPLHKACEMLASQKPELWKNYQLARTDALGR
jgi:hypothetical protein